MNSSQKLQDELDLYTSKYEVALKEKMLMKLEKDRLVAKVENLQMSLEQLNEDTRS
jgi:hypothetical protein